MFEDLSGNRIIDNVIGRNNVGSPAVPGDPLDGPPAQDFLTTGILVFSGTVPVHVTIWNNVIFDDHYGIWLGVNGNVTVSRHGNSFRRRHHACLHLQLSSSSPMTSVDPRRVARWGSAPGVRRIAPAGGGSRRIRRPLK